MAPDDDQAGQAAQIQTMKIIIVALTLGPLFLLGIALFLRQERNPAAAPGQRPMPIITYSAFAMAVGLVPLSLLVPALLVKSARLKIAKGTWAPPPQGGAGEAPAGPFSDERKLLFAYQTALIVGAALNEGCAFLAAVSYLIEGVPAVIGLAVALILGVAARFPTAGRIERWLTVQQELLFQERQGGW